MIVQNVSEDGKYTDVTFTVDRSDLDHALSILGESKDEIDYLVERDSIALDSCKTLYKKSELEPFINNAKQQLVSTSRKIKENLDNLVSSYGVLV